MIFNLSFGLGILFSLIVLIFYLIKNIEITKSLTATVLAFLFGLMVLPGFDIVFYFFTNNLLFKESILEYNNYLGLGGLIIFIVSVWGFISLLKKKDAALIFGSGPSYKIFERIKRNNH